MPLAHIAEQVGYESEAAFNRAFKHNFGVPPATWRRDVSDVAKPLATSPPNIGAAPVSNPRSVALSPPSHWPDQRRREYVDWASAVAAGLVGVSDWLDNQFEEVFITSRNKYR